VILDSRIAYQSIQSKLAYYALPECWRISLLGSMSELAQPLLSLTPNRRATQAHTHTHHTATALRQLLSAVQHLHVCVSGLLPPPPRPSNADPRTVGRNRWMPAKQMTPATEHTSFWPKWRHSTANLQTFPPQVSMLDQRSAVLLIWPYMRSA